MPTSLFEGCAGWPGYGDTTQFPASGTSRDMAKAGRRSTDSRQAWAYKESGTLFFLQQEDTTAPSGWSPFEDQITFAGESRELSTSTSWNVSMNREDSFLLAYHASGVMNTYIRSADASFELYTQHYEGVAAGSPSTADSAPGASQYSTDGFVMCWPENTTFPNNDLYYSIFDGGAGTWGAPINAGHYFDDGAGSLYVSTACLESEIDGTVHFTGIWSGKPGGGQGGFYYANDVSLRWEEGYHDNDSGTDMEDVDMAVSKVAGDTGVVYAVYVIGDSPLSGGPLNSKVMFSERTNEEGWLGAELLSDTNKRAKFPNIVCDSSGDIYVTYAEYDPNSLHRTIWTRYRAGGDGSGQWCDPVTVGLSQESGADEDGDGEIFPSPFNPHFIRPVIDDRLYSVCVTWGDVETSGGSTDQVYWNCGPVLAEDIPQDPPPPPPPDPTGTSIPDPDSDIFLDRTLEVSIQPLPYIPRERKRYPISSVNFLDAMDGIYLELTNMIGSLGAGNIILASGDIAIYGNNLNNYGIDQFKNTDNPLQEFSPPVFGIDSDIVSVDGDNNSSIGDSSFTIRSAG